jgi:hypothetical protein
MFQIPRALNAWHRVTAPGGYEVWRLEAEDGAGELRMAARLWEGSPSDREYRRACERYLRRPTRQRPPVPGDCIGASLTVWRGGRVWGEFCSRAGTFAASGERVEVRVGANELVEVDGGLKLVMKGGNVEGEWTFRSLETVAGWEGVFPSRAIARAEHRWLLPAGAYGVEGVIRVGGERLTMSGRGYHDHLYGTGPMGERVRYWIRGRVTLEGRTVAFAVAYPRRSGAGVEAVLIEADGAGVRQLLEEFDQKGPGDRPAEMAFGRALKLGNPRDLGGKWVEYDAMAGGEAGRAVCEIVEL